MERFRCSDCGAIYPIEKEECPVCKCKERTKMILPDSPWDDD